MIIMPIACYYNLQLIIHSTDNVNRLLLMMVYSVFILLVGFAIITLREHTDEVID